MIQRSLIRQSRALQSQSFIPRTFPLSLRHPISSRLPAPLRARIISRWYAASSEAQTQTNEAPPASEPLKAAAEKEKPGEQEDPVAKELDAAKKEIIELKDKYLRSVADFRNLQERTRREVQAARDFALQKFARDLVESVDNLDRALSMVDQDKLVDENKELQQLHGGLKMTESILMSTLKKHGLERFDPAENGEKFDPNIHDATFQTPQPDKEDGTVFHTTQKGFMLNGRVLRAAKVGVVKNS